MRLIDADFLKEWVDEYLSVFKKYDKSEVKGFVDHAPTIEPKRGEWINKIVDDVKITVCSNCNKEPTFTHYYGSCGNYSLSDFCPNCGARMKGADDE